MKSGSNLEKVLASGQAAFAAGPEKTASGLVYESLKDGQGAQPNTQSTVEVHYRGTLANGTEFDSSYKRNEPAEFALGGVVRVSQVQLLQPFLSLLFLVSALAMA